MEINSALLVIIMIYHYSSTRIVNINKTKQKVDYQILVKICSSKNFHILLMDIQIDLFSSAIIY